MALFGFQMTDYGDASLLSYDPMFIDVGEEVNIANNNFGEGVLLAENLQEQTPSVPTEGQLWPRGNTNNN